MRNSRGRPLLLAIACAVAACNRADIAAVTELPPPDTAVATLRVGGRDGGGHELVAPLAVGGSSVAVDQHGRMMVAQRGEYVVWVFDSTGQLITRFGRTGQGPGEFAVYPTALGFRGDTLWASDYRSRRVNLFSVEGDHIGTVRFDDIDIAREQGLRIPLSYLDGAAVFDTEGTVSVRNAPANKSLPDGGYLLRVTTAAPPRLDTLAALPPRRMALAVTMASGSATTGSQPMFDGALYAVSADGDDLVTVVRDVLTDSSTGLITLRRINLLTGERDSASLMLPPDPMPQAIADSIINRRANQTFNFVESSFPSLDAALAAYTEALHVPWLKPVLGAAFLSVDGQLWLRLWATEDWLLFDSQLRLQQRVRLPEGVSDNVRAAGTDFLLATGLSQEDEPQLVRYSIPR